jgi:hypothetical protein
MIESTFDRVIYQFTTKVEYHIVGVIDIDPIRERFSAVAPFLDERRAAQRQAAAGIVERSSGR